jgi:(2R)-sulfolactate sulfo-lyase subunit alpha
MALATGFLAHRNGDNVAVAVQDVPPGRATVAYLDTGESRDIDLRAEIPMGHKVALSALEEGKAVIEYGQRVGVATCSIASGDLVHVHNIRSARW